MPDPFVHLELNSTEVNIPMGDLDYTIIKVGKGTGGGIMAQLIPGAPSSWLPYVAADDISAATKRATLGAKS